MVCLSILTAPDISSQNIGGDAVDLISAATESGQPLRRGQPTPLVVTLTYNLISHDSAILTLSTAQFRDPSTCGGSDELVDAEERLVKRGSGTVTLHITWSGDTGEKTRGRVFGRGMLGFRASFWKAINGGRGLANEWETFGNFPLGSRYCAAF